MDKKDRPDFVKGEALDMRADVELMRHVYAGTSKLRERGVRYLPRHPAEEMANYDARLGQSTLFNGVARTVSGLSGMVFQRDPALGEDVPNKIKEHVENVNNQGMHIDVFAKGLFEDALLAGHSFVLIDHPKTDDGAIVTLADEMVRGIKPYWIHVRLEDVINWHTTVIDGRVLLEDVVIRESNQVRDGAYGEKAVEQFRVYRRATDGSITYELFQIINDAISTIDSGPVTNVTEIPLVPIYAGRTGFFTSRPPLLDLGQLNIGHYALRSDYLWMLKMSNLPILTRTGVPSPGGETLPVGPNTLVDLPEGATLSFTEPSGAAAGATRQELQDMKLDMASMGLALLASEPRYAETAEAKRIDRSQSDSALATAARSLQDGLETALRFHAQFLGLEDGGSIGVNRDFMERQLTHEQVRTLSEMVAAQNLSVETMWKLLAEGGVLPDDFDPDIERERVEAAGLMFADEGATGGFDGDSD